MLQNSIGHSCSVDFQLFTNLKDKTKHFEKLKRYSKSTKIFEIMLVKYIHTILLLLAVFSLTQFLKGTLKSNLSGSGKNKLSKSTPVTSNDTE